MPQFYFIRHGQSTNNVIYDHNEHDDYLLERTTDPNLTELGEEQAQLTAQSLAQPFIADDRFDPQNRFGFGLTHLYSSLMLRAVRTGLAIAEATQLPLIGWPDLHETGGLFDIQIVDGELDFFGQPGPGRSYFQSNFPQLVLPDELSEDGWYNKAKEPADNYLPRARQIVEHLIATHSGTNHRVGIVMHGGIFMRILTALFNIQVERYWLLMNNCAISRIDISPEGHVLLNYMNKCDHLPDHLIT